MREVATEDYCVCMQSECELGSGVCPVKYRGQNFTDGRGKADALAKYIGSAYGLTGGTPGSLMLEG